MIPSSFRCRRRDRRLRRRRRRRRREDSRVVFDGEASLSEGMTRFE